MQLSAQGIEIMLTMFKKTFREVAEPTAAIRHLN
jgi:hypothetical protein